MLDPDWALTSPLLWLAIVGLVAGLVVRTVRKDRREYRRFRQYRTTAKRQAMLRRWLWESFATFGGISVALLLLAGFAVAPLLQELTTWPGVRELRGLVANNGGLVLGAVIGVALGFAVLTTVGIRAARSEQQVPMVGDIAAMLPRNRQELRLGALLSVNAGVVEETLFRLAIPAAIYGASGSAVAAVVASVVLFGSLHAYQGAAGIIASTVVGALMVLLYAVSGTIVVPIVVHVLLDLRSLVVIPVGVYGVHKIDGAVHPVTKPLGQPAATAPATSPPPPPESTLA